MCVKVVQWCGAASERLGGGYLAGRMIRMHRVVPLFAALLLTVSSTGQDASLVPGIRDELAKATNDTARADALARICFNLIRSQPDSARLVGEQALALAQRIGNKRAIGDALNDLGWLATEQGDLAQGEEKLTKALAIFQQMGKPAYVSVVLSNLGWLADKKSDRVGALKRFQEALREAELAKDSASTSVLLYSIGTTYSKMKEYAQAREYVQRSLDLERVLGRQNKVANCLLAIGNTLRSEGDTAKAMDLYAQAADVYRALHDHGGAGLVEENAGGLYAGTDPAKALVYFRKALAEYDSIDSPEDKAYVMRSMGAAHIALEHLEEASADLEQGAGLARQVGNTELVMDYELAFAELASKKGDSRGTLAHYQRYMSMKDSLQGEGTQRELARLRTEFETERKEKDNAILRAENSEQVERLRRRDLQLYGSIALGVLAMIAAFLFWRNYEQKQRHVLVLDGLNKELANSNAEITEINGLLEMKVLRSQMNPHFIYNCLNSAARMTQAGQSTEALLYLQGFARLLRMVLDHSVKDRITINEELDFLRQYLKLEAHRLDGLHYEVDAESVLIDDEVELPALLVQPFVENAVWHGLAEKQGDRSISVRFEQRNGSLVCIITDNGIGRDRSAVAPKSDPQHKSLGMQLTNERLRLLSRRLGEAGSFRVEDLKDPAGAALGTRVTLQLPLDR